MHLCFISTLVTRGYLGISDDFALLIGYLSFSPSIAVSQLLGEEEKNNRDVVKMRLRYLYFIFKVSK